MNNKPSIAPVGKGQLRCFKCKKALPMKDGNWHDHNNQQVFLCKSCERTQREPN